MDEDIRENSDRLAQQENSESTPKKRKRWIIYFGIIAVLGILSAFAYGIFLRYLNAIPEVKVPDVVNLTETDALVVLEEYKLSGYMVGKRYSEDISPNHVLETIPEAGRTVKVGRKVGYVLSRGEEMMFLPDLKGLNLEQAGEILQEKNFTIQQGEQFFSSEYREGIIISQDPKGGEYVTKDAAITVFTSMGYPVSINISQIEPGYDRLLVRIDMKLLDDNSKTTNVKIMSVKFDESQLLYNEDVRTGKELFFEIEEEIGARIEVYLNDVLAKARKVLF